MNLTKVEKPARYAGGELNSIVKQNAKLNFALLFADVYEVGMSHLGIQILYEALNSREEIWAQRAFCPWPDMIAQMREQGEPLRTLEGGIPLKDCDIVGINLSYEMCYTNVLAMLDLGGIPLHANERGEGTPIVLGGGACVSNPEPVAAFFDAFVIGEGEEVTLEVCDVYMRHKGSRRKALLRALAQVPGVYVPSLYSVEYNEDNTVQSILPVEGAPKRVQKRFVADFDAAQAITRPVLPYLGTVHDRCVLEIMRGCANGCRFCQAGYTMRPVRARSRETLMAQAESVIAATGYDEISLSSLSSGDYPGVGDLIDELVNRFSPGRVSVSLPSLRVNTFDFARQLSQVRKTGLTFAPEAGTQRLRDVINKNITDEDILTSVRRAFEGGVSSVKLYFMIGLPTETYEDLDGIISLVKAIQSEYYAVPKEQRGGGGGRGKLAITVSASCFVPKPATPFQWEPQDDIATLREKQFYLKDGLKIRGVKFNYHDARTSFLEAVLARGDRRLSHAIEAAYHAGAVFDAWQEHFSMERYEAAFAACGIVPQFYANRRRETDEVLPWSHIDMLLSEEYFKRELRRAYETAATPSCSEVCAGCGLQKNGCAMHE